MSFSNKTLNIIVILAFIIQAVFLQQTFISSSSTCQDTSFENLLQSGTYSLTNPRTGTSRVHTFQIVVNYNIPTWGFNVAVSTGRIVGYNQAYGTDYSIRGARLDSTNIANFLLLINEDLSWTSIRASFIISSRIDFYLGAFLPDTLNLYSSSNSSFIAQYNVPNWIATANGVSYIYLISGIKTSDNSFSLDLAQAGFNPQSGLISVKVSSNADQVIQMIYITYVVFYNSAPYVMTVYNPLVSSVAATHFYEGIDSLNGNTIVYEGYAINSTSSQSSTIPCIGSNCPSPCVIPSRCSSANGGVIYLNQCFLCGFEEAYSNGQCLARCTGNQTWSGSSCVCKTGYTRINGVCRILNCALNQIFNGVQCVCDNGYQRVNGLCQFICPTSTYWNGTQCTCIQGYIKVNDRCAYQCITNGYINDAGSCVCLPGYIRNNFNQCVQTSCGINQIYDSTVGRCVCKDGYLFSRNQCLLKCPGDFTNSVIYQGICVCIEGYDVVNGRCVRTVTCNKANQILVNGQCSCISGYQYNSLGFCVVNCLSNEVFINDICQCVSGYVRNSQNICVKICSTNQVSIGGVCQCLNGYSRNSQGICSKICSTNQIAVNDICQCISLYSRNSAGICIKVCPANEVLVGNSCQCVSGYVRGVNGICTKSCSNNEVLVGNQCQCARNFFRNYSGNCVRSCPANQTPINNICSCQTGFNRNTQGICVRSCGFNEYLVNDQCVCIPGYARDSRNACTIQVPICSANQTLVNNRCQCIDGYYRVGSNCISLCRINQIYDSAAKQCICKDGYGISSRTGLCDICPANSHSSGLLTGCICDTGLAWNSTSLRCEVIVCQPNASLNRNGQCICNSGYYLDGTQCKRTPTCPSRSTWDSTKLSCICTVSSQYLINGSCQPCQSNSAWNGTACACRTGYYLISGSCVQCSSNSQYVRGNCVCNFGYFGNGITCNACHSSCGTCSNSFSNGCLTCVNVSYTLSNGICTQKLCDTGFYYDLTASKCSKCIDYCQTCSDSTTCNQCLSGFQIFRQNFGSITIISCIETCGDGKAFYEACDDGNTVNGDGCNSTCQVQNGWTCVGGSPTSKSQCYSILPSASKLVQGGNVILQGEVLQGIGLTYIPAGLTATGCPQCDNILNVSIISSPIIPTITVDFITATHYKFVIRFNFGAFTARTNFNFTVRISNSFSSYFTTQDMQQVLVIQIDTALLSQADQTSQLTFQATNTITTNPTTQSSSGDKLSDIQISGVPSQAISLLYKNIL